MESTAPAVSYKVNLLPERHELEIELLIPELEGGATIPLQIPSWVPGDYEFAPFGRDIFDIAAYEINTNKPLAVSRVGWHEFQIQRGMGGARVSYRAYAYSIPFSEACGILDSGVGVLLGTRYLRVAGWSGAYRVEYRVPDGWRIHHPAGAVSVGNRQWEYPNYEILLDTPVVVGHFDSLERRVAETPFYFVFLDRTLGFASQSAAWVDAVARVAAEFQAIFGFFPFESYTFVLSTHPAFDWGLEHLTSTMCGLGPDVFVDTQLWATGVRVCAHELFHAWNVRRLRPAPLNDLDLENGSFTDALWVAEGFTRYYEFLACVRTGTYTVSQFFSAITNYYNHLIDTPAYARVSATDSSLASYLNHRKYPGRCNNSIDYYDKGMLLAFSIDAALRLRTGSDNLDRAFSEFYQSYVHRQPGYTTRDVIEFFAARLGELRAIIERGAQHPGGLAIEILLNELGFRIVAQETRRLGLMFLDQRNAIYGVLDDSPAGGAGVAPDDIPVAVDGFPFSLKYLSWAAEHDDRVELAVQRGNTSRVFSIIPEAKSKIVSLEWIGTEKQATRIREWFRTSDFHPAKKQLFALEFYENFHGVETVI